MGGPQGRSEQVRNLYPSPGVDSRTIRVLRHADPFCYFVARYFYYVCEGWDKRVDMEGTNDLISARRIYFGWNS